MDPTLTEETVDLREYLAVLRARKWSILLVVVLVIAAALAFSLTQTPLYTAQAKVLVAGPAGSLSNLINLETEREIAGSQPVATRVRDDLGLQKTVGELLATVDVTGITETEVLEIAYTSADPTEAQQIANSFADNYLAQRRSDALEILVEEQEALQQRIDTASEQLTEISNEIEAADSAGNDVLATSLENERSVAIARLGVLQQELDNMQTRRTSSIPRGQVIEAAQLPRAPTSPNYVSNAVLAAMLGIALGVGLAFLRERLDDRFRGKADIERIVEAPVLGTIPRFRSGKKAGFRQPVSVRTPRGIAAEAFRSLRTNVQFLASQRGIKSLLVTSPSAREGKTSTAVNLAAVMAQAGIRVILVSADLRRPTLEDHFGDRERKAGLSTWLSTSQDDVWEMLEDPGIPNIRVMPCGPIPPNPAELLTSPRLNRLVQILEANSDLVIFDSPPVLAVADASIIASEVRGTLLVIDARLTHRTAALHAREEVERVGGVIVGGVLNSFDPDASPYYYGPYLYYGANAPAGEGGNGAGSASVTKKARLRFRRS